jgi:guanylate kinase
MSIIKKKKVFCIIGESCSGKDHLVKFMGLLDPKYRQVVSYTSRPKRDNETDGVEHYFLNEREFAELKKNHAKDIVAYTRITDPNNPNGGYEYMAMKDELNKSLFYIIDPNGLDYLKETVGDEYDLISIYIYCPFEMRKKRSQKNRNDEKKFMKRYMEERMQFDHYYRHRCFDYVIYNLDGLQTESENILKRIVEYELNERDIDHEYISVMSTDHIKNEINEAVSFLGNLLDLYTAQFIKNNQLVRVAESQYKFIRNILLSHLR